MTTARRLAVVICGALVSLSASGCFVGAVNPSYFPSWFGFGRIAQTHAKPGGRGYFENFDPKAVRLEVRPLRSTNPVGRQQLIIATILDQDENARRKRRVEWMLEGVGTIVEVDESGFLPGRGYKVDNRYAVSYTDLREHTITRGNDDPSDDFVIRPGQTWCIITSPMEGESRLTVYAPEIYDWEQRTATVTLFWSDYQWQFPAPTAARAGSPYTLTTHIFRQSDRAPAPNFQVRYRLLDGGPPAEFLPDRRREVVVTSDASGNAAVGIQQLALQPGINRIGIDIIRPATDSRGMPVVLASQETTIDWQAPRIQMRFNAPQSAALNQEVPATITISNPSPVETQTGAVYVQVPPGLAYLRSDPPARLDDRGYLVFDLASLPAGREQSIQVIFRAKQQGAFPARVVAATRDDLRAEEAATIRIEPGQLRVGMSGPRTGIVGVPVDCEIQVTNPSQVEVSRVLLDLWLPAGVVAIVPNGARFENKLQNDRVGPLRPGETRTLPIRLEGRRPGRVEIRAMASGDAGLNAEASLAIDFQLPEAELKRQGPARVYVGRDNNWSLLVRNPGAVPIRQAILRDRLPPELAFRSATNGGTYDARSREVVWNIDEMAPGEERVFTLTAYAAQPSTKALFTARLTGAPNIDVPSETPIEILGIPALRVDVTADANPVQLGSRVTYTIRLTNQGTLPLDQVDVSAEASPVLRVLGGYAYQWVAPKGNRIIFPALRNLAPNQTITLQALAQAIEGGDGRLRVIVQSSVLPAPIISEEATTILPPLR
jgi:hypothetical protein